LESLNGRLFPAGRVDEHGQQVDLRNRNSWVLQMGEVSVPELAEVHIINAMAPFVLNSKLLPLLRQSPFKDKFIINVSSVEGEFYHKKTTSHPHTNMAKASLNMMTRTGAAHYAKYQIWMNAVDTGWISDMNPVKRSQNIGNKYGELFRNPIDEIDGAARILDPIFSRVRGGQVLFGRFLKDFVPAAW
jgi:NAD(P)-dependent dehydrogenase (short-subunit alcohol dehydrogenase family)